MARFNAKQLTFYEDKLKQQQLELLSLTKTSQDASKTVELDQTSVGRLSRMDALQDQAMARERLRRRELELKKINAALRRIESGDYGYCIHCEEEIAVKRLQFAPAASLCIDCARRLQGD